MPDAEDRDRAQARSVRNWGALAIATGLLGVPVVFYLFGTMPMQLEILLLTLAVVGAGLRIEAAIRERS